MITIFQRFCYLGSVIVVSSPLFISFYLLLKQPVKRMGLIFIHKFVTEFPQQGNSPRDYETNKPNPINPVLYNPNSVLSDSPASEKDSQCIRRVSTGKLQNTNPVELPETSFNASNKPFTSFLDDSSFHPPDSTTGENNASTKNEPNPSVQSFERLSTLCYSL